MATDSTSIATASSSVTEEELTLTVKWSGKEYTVRVCGDDSVAELKRRICQLTNVLPKRKKLLYPKVGNKLSDDSLLLSQLPLKSSLKMTMIGTVEDDIIVDPVDTPEIIDDFELGLDEAVDIKDKDVNKQKLKRRIDQYKVNMQMQAGNNNHNEQLINLLGPAYEFEPDEKYLVTRILRPQIADGCPDCIAPVLYMNNLNQTPEFLSENMFHCQVENKCLYFLISGAVIT